MKISSDSNFPIQLMSESSERMREQENYALYEGIFWLELNHSTDVYLVPSVDRDLLDYKVVETMPAELNTVEEARAHTALSADAVIAPHQELAGQDQAVPIANLPSGDQAHSSESVKVLYVSPEQYAELEREISGILSLLEAPADPETEHKYAFEKRFKDRHDAPRIDEIGHLAIGRFIKTRLLHSTIVDTHMLRDPS